jgi:lysophospholipase L1-like esterase
LSGSKLKHAATRRISIFIGVLVVASTLAAHAAIPYTQSITGTVGLSSQIALVHSRLAFHVAPHRGRLAGPVLGLGDSVAAGYGLGQSQGYPDNPLAYPAVLARSLDVPYQNYAVAGACAASSESRTCSKRSVDWQILQVPRTFVPAIITITVGADDIHFSDCYKAVFDPRNPDISFHAPDDPCNPTTLSKNLAAFQSALGSDIQTLHARYPAAQVLIMDYYNPFPGPNEPLCPVNEALAAIYEHAHGDSWAAIATDYFLHTDAFVGEARSIQSRLNAASSAAVDQLNGAIGDEISGRAAVIEVGNFKGHDMCAGGSAWSFAPTLGLDLEILGRTGSLSYGGGPLCPDPVSAREWNGRAQTGFPGGRVSIAVGINCTPHPTAEGQVAISKDFASQR